MHFVEHTHQRSAPLLSVRELQVGYGRHSILPKLTFELRREEFWAVIGRNGSGKSTLIRTLLGLQPRVGGELQRMDGLRVGYVPQRTEWDQGVPARVCDVVRGGLDHAWSFLNPFRSGPERLLERQALEETDTLELAHLQYRQLSEGQKQRVLLARALMISPQLLVLDEPTSAMDLVAERTVFDLIERLRRRHHLGLIVVSHHLALVAERATDVLFLDREDQVAMAGCIADIAASQAFKNRFGDMDCAAVPEEQAFRSRSLEEGP